MDRRSFFKSLAALVVAGPFIQKRIAALNPPDYWCYERGFPPPPFNPKAYFGKWQFITVGPAPFPHNAGETIR